MIYLYSSLECKHWLHFNNRHPRIRILIEYIPKQTILVQIHLQHLYNYIENLSAMFTWIIFVKLTNSVIHIFRHRDNTSRILDPLIIYRNSRVESSVGYKAISQVDLLPRIFMLKRVSICYASSLSNISFIKHCN